MRSTGKVGSRSLRQVNRSVILDLIRSEDRVSRSELARRSGLTKPTVSAIVDGLLQEGIVREVGYGDSESGGGRPARLIEFYADSAAYLGIEFGLRQTKVALADGRGRIVSVISKPAVLGDPPRTMRRLKTLVARILKQNQVPKSRVQAVGATVPGLVDQTTGVCRLAPNLGWKNYPLRDTLETMLEQSVVVTNITQAGAVAEGRLGAVQGVRSYVWLYLGHGIGAGIVLDGSPFEGTRGFAGEIGHCRISDRRVRCGCGKLGHLEAFTSTMAVLREARILAAKHPASALAEIALDDIAPVLEVARAGDPVAHGLLKRVARDVGKGASILLNLFDPEYIVVGGDLAAAGDFFTQTVARSVRDHALSADAVRVVRSNLGDRAGLLGSVLLAMDRSHQSYRVIAGSHHAGMKRW